MPQSEAPSTTIDGKARHYAITIKKPPEEVYSFWRQLNHFPSFTLDLEEVNIISERESQWVGRLKSGRPIDWKALITEEHPHQFISWTSLSTSQISTTGSVHFRNAPKGQGTIVQLAMDFKITSGMMAEWSLFFSGERPDFLITTSLKRLKALLETGEIPTIEGQPHGRSEEIDDTDYLEKDAKGLEL